jgi:anti-anti-sigma regulatory factor
MPSALDAPREELSPGEVVIRIDSPSFDAMAALQLERRLDDIPRGTRVVVDFSHVRDLGDLGVAVLASGLQGAGRNEVVMRGLCHHQERMLEYLGLDARRLCGDHGKIH